MTIQPIQSNGTALSILKRSEAKQESNQVVEKQHHELDAKERYTPSRTANLDPKITYDKPTIDNESINRLKAESELAYNHLRAMVEELLRKQGLTFQDVNADTGLEVDEATRLEAQSLISEGGDLSAENMSDRIVEFAITIAGGDQSKFEEIKAAIEEGFNQAAQVLGGVLPEVSSRTYDLVMEKLDRWKEHGGS